MGTSINHTVALNLKNKGNSNVSKGDVVIIDKVTASAFTLTGSLGFIGSTLGVVFDQVGITTGSSGMVVIEGYCPQINLISGSNIGDTFYLSSVQQKAQSHSSIFPGDFVQTLSSGLTPDAILWGFNENNISDFVQSIYTGSNFNLGTSVDSGYVDVDATNAKVTFTPKAPGNYMVTFIFNHYFAASGQFEVTFRLFDGLTPTVGLQRFIPSGSSEVPITISWVFNWTDTTTRTIKLQKYTDAAAGASAHTIYTTSLGLGFIMQVFRISS